MKIDSCLVDTNVLLRVGSRGDSRYPMASHAIDELKISGVPLFYAHQNIAELWNVMTRPVVRNGFGLSIREAEAEVHEIETGMQVLAESTAAYLHWRRLLVDHRVRGVQVHDARLVAIMLIHGVTHLLTFNTADFRRFSEIEAIHPSLIGQRPE